MKFFFLSVDVRFCSSFSILLHFVAQQSFGNCFKFAKFYLKSRLNLLDTGILWRYAFDLLSVNPFCLNAFIFFLEIYGDKTFSNEFANGILEFCSHKVYIRVLCKSFTMKSKIERKNHLLLYSTLSGHNFEMCLSKA